jgi:hypothetical protein
MSLAQLKTKMAAILAAKNEALAAETLVGITSNVGTKQEIEKNLEVLAEPALVSTTVSTAVNKNEVTYDMLNPKQKLAVTFAEERKSFCLIGGAGTGKTTSTRSVVQKLVEDCIIGKLTEGTDRVLREGAPSVAVLSFTNQAVRNIKEALPMEFKSHCSTIHKILEYSPIYDEVDITDTQGLPTGETKKTMWYEPGYGTQPDGKGGGAFLPHMDVVIFEEAGSIPEDLHTTFLSALPYPDRTIVIYLGDLNQLPPVFGDAILGFKLLELPVVELTEVYRNVGLITQLAQRILEGKPILDRELAKWSKGDSSGTILLKPFVKKLDWEVALVALGTHFKQLVVEGAFDMNADVLLIPFNKQLGTIEMNKWLQHGEDLRTGREVHQVISGYLKLYFAVGDKVLYNKTYCRITDITPTSTYFGEEPLHPSAHLDRWGRIGKGYEYPTTGHSVDVADIEAMMEQSLEALEESTATRASHTFTLEVMDSSMVDDHGRSPIWNAASTGEVNGMLAVHAMTIHKAQGSEWRKVWGILHHSHAVALKREALYTLITRAREDLTLYYTGTKTQHKIGGSVFSQGITKQELAGNTLEHKLDYFRKQLQKKSFKNSKNSINAKLKRKAADSNGMLDSSTHSVMKRSMNV